jgi:hypothetical protein
MKAVLLGSLVVLVGCASAPAPVASSPPAQKVEEPKAAPITKAMPPAEPTKGATAPSLATVIKEAKAAGTMPLLMFSTVWCGPCEIVEREVLPKPEVVQALAPFRFQKYDAEIGEGLAAAQKFGVSSYPTIIFLDADGEEVARNGVAMNPAQFIAELNAELPLAKAAKAAEKDGDPATSNDPAKLLVAAKAEEERPDLAKAKKLFAAAAALATTQKKPDVEAEASFALLQLETRERDRKEHAAKLVAFVKAHAPAPKALDALEGAAGASADGAVKPADVKASAAKLEAALLADHKDADLRRLAAALKKIGDEEGAKRVDAEAAKEGSNKPTTPEPFRFADPLGSKFTFSTGKGSGLSAQTTFQGMTTRRLVEDCHQLPHPDQAINVRVYTANGAITRAVVLDPELAAELRTCLETSATSIKNVPSGVAAKSEVHVLFSPIHATRATPQL